MPLFFRYINKVTSTLIIVTILFTSCMGDETTSQSNIIEETISLTIISGNNQVGIGGEALASPVIVKAVNTENLPLTDVALYVDRIEGGIETPGGPIFYTDTNGEASIPWVIGESYNTLEINFSNGTEGTDPVYAYAQGENPSRLWIAKTLNSLVKLSDKVYEITFYGDYDERVESINELHLAHLNGAPNGVSFPSFNCSVFATTGDPQNILFGRSFDNPAGWDCITLLCRFYPPDGYSSLVPTRTMELGFDPPQDLTQIPISARMGLLNAPFYSPDGINEHGVVVALADISSRAYTPDSAKRYMYKTYLIRKILDHALNVEEAAEIARNYNLFDYGRNIFSTHALVADANGDAILIEIAEGEVKIIRTENPWFVATNTGLYNVSVEQAKNNCGRYRYLYDRLESVDGIINTDQGLNILQTVGVSSTQWSIIYDITNKVVNLVQDMDFAHPFRFNFDY